MNDIKDQITNSTLNKKPLHIKNAFSLDIPWNDFIENINMSVKELSDQPEKTEVKYGRVGDVRFYDRMTMVIDYAYKYRYTGIDEIVQQIQSYGLEIITFMSLISLTDSESTTSKHLDPYSVLYIQCIGSAQWSIWNNDVADQFVLNKGDFIFVPSYLTHEVKSLSPRAALSFMVK